jgi:predicted transcriptional regulator
MVDEIILNENLSKYNKYILNRIIGAFSADKDFNVYELVRESVSYKCILPSQNALIMETYYAIKEYLLLFGFLMEKQEMIVYSLTEKGQRLKDMGTIEKYEEYELRKSKPSIFHKLFFEKPTAVKHDSYK